MDTGMLFSLCEKNKMTEPQIIVYTISGLILLFGIRRIIQRAGMKEYLPKQVEEKMHEGSVLLLDVRSRKERAYQHIKGSVHIPVSELSRKLDTLEKYREKEIICYCHSGSRSAAAVSILHKNGFAAANMKGGMIEWNSQKLK
jgi:rhodanese-related sulfurtransferase